MRALIRLYSKRIDCDLWGIYFFRHTTHQFPNWASKGISTRNGTIYERVSLNSKLIAMQPPCELNTKPITNKLHQHSTTHLWIQKLVLMYRTLIVNIACIVIFNHNQAVLRDTQKKIVFFLHFQSLQFTKYWNILHNTKIKFNFASLLQKLNNKKKMSFRNYQVYWILIHNMTEKFNGNLYDFYWFYSNKYLNTS